MEVGSMFALLLEKHRESEQRDKDIIEVARAVIAVVEKLQGSVDTQTEELRALSLAVSQEPASTDVGEQLARLTSAVARNTEVMGDVARLMMAEKKGGAANGGQ